MDVMLFTMVAGFAVSMSDDALAQPSTPPAGAGENLNLFVANVASEVTDEMMEKAFSDFGEIMSCKVMLDIHTGISRGFGFVLFRNADEGARAMKALHGAKLGSKHIYISVAQTTGHSGLQQTPKMYVRNVPKMQSMEALRVHFAQHGEIVRLNFKDDHTLSKCPAEARQYVSQTTVVFLEYRTAEQANAAVRATHNTKPWPNMAVPLLAKPAETTQMRNERRQRQQHKTGTASNPSSAASSATSPTVASPNSSVSTFGSSNPSSGHGYGSGHTTFACSPGAPPPYMPVQAQGMSSSPGPMMAPVGANGQPMFLVPVQQLQMANAQQVLPFPSVMSMDANQSGTAPIALAEPASTSGAPWLNNNATGLGQSPAFMLPLSTTDSSTDVSQPFS